MPTKIQGGLGKDKVQDGTVGLSDCDTELYGKIAALTTINLGEAKTASGTVVDFDVPEGVKRVTVMFDGVSTNGSSLPLVRLGDGLISETDYLSVANQVGTSSNPKLDTSGFLLNYENQATRGVSGYITIVSDGDNTWHESGNMFLLNSAAVCLSAGTKSLSGTLDRIRITTVNGTDTFDSGTINISWEF